MRIKFNSLLYKTNRFHVAVGLFSNRSQMTSKCGKNKKVAHEAIAECVTDTGIYLLIIYTVYNGNSYLHCLQ